MTTDNTTDNRTFDKKVYAGMPFRYKITKARYWDKTVAKSVNGEYGRRRCAGALRRGYDYAGRHGPFRFGGDFAGRGRLRRLQGRGGACGQAVFSVQREYGL